MSQLLYTLRVWSVYSMVDGHDAHQNSYYHRILLCRKTVATGSTHRMICSLSDGHVNMPTQGWRPPRALPQCNPR
jgi:hypothetical protein